MSHGTLYEKRCDIVTAHGYPAVIERDGQFSAWVSVDK
jgi:hypothetical protein